MNHGDNTLIKVTYEIVLFDRISSPDKNENKKNLVDILTENNQVLENKLTYLNTLRLKHQPYTGKNIFGGFHVSFSKHWLKNGGRYVKVKTPKCCLNFRKEFAIFPLRGAVSMCINQNIGII